MLINSQHTWTAYIIFSISYLQPRCDRDAFECTLSACRPHTLLLCSCWNCPQSFSKHYITCVCEGRARLVDLRVGTAPPILSFVSVCSAEQWEEKLTQVRGHTLPGRDSAASGWNPASCTSDLCWKNVKLDHFIRCYLSFHQQDQMLLQLRHHKSFPFEKKNLKHTNGTCHLCNPDLSGQKRATLYFTLSRNMRIAGDYLAVILHYTMD